MKSVKPCKRIAVGSGEKLRNLLRKVRRARGQSRYEGEKKRNGRC